MAAYLGHIVTLSLKNEGGEYCGRLIAHNHVNGKIVLSKVTCITTGKKLPGNQTFFHDEIIPDSMVVTDEVSNETAKIDGASLKEKSKSMALRGSKCTSSRTMPICGDLQRETFQLAAFMEFMQKAGDSDDVPENLLTANVYERLEQLPHRDEWKQKLNKKQRPIRYIVIDALGEGFDEAIFRIKAEDTISISFTGIDISRRGTLCWIQVAASDVVYLFDAYTMGHACISYGLDAVLTSPTLLKVTHDCRYISDLLFHQYNIKMINIFDTQVAAVIESRAMNGGHYPAYVRSLQSLVEDLLPIDKNEYHVYKIRQAFKDTEENLWSRRPMHHYLLDSLAKTVSYMNELRDILIRRMMNDFYVAIDAYVSSYRNLTDEESRSAQPDPHILPPVFKTFQRRDEARSRRTQSKEGENMFNSEGLVETMENPSDLYYKRDSIMHAKLRSNAQAPPSAVKGRGQPASGGYVVPAHLQRLLPKSTTSSTTLCTSSNASSGRRTSISSNSSPVNPIRTASSCSISSVSSNSAKTGTSPAVDYHHPNRTHLKEEVTHPVKEIADKDCKSSVIQESDDLSWQPKVHQSNSSHSMLGASASKRTYRVGRGSPISPSKVSTVQYERLAQVARTAEEDYDSGVDSGTPTRTYPEHIINTIGCVSGFQNLEKMGHAPLSINHIPEEFDIRSASLQDLRLLSKATNNMSVASDSRSVTQRLAVSSTPNTITETSVADDTIDSDIEWDS